MAEPGPNPRWRVVELSPEQTHPLRRAVLRDGVADAVVRFAEDEWPGVRHLGVVDGPSDPTTGDELIATSTWVPRTMTSAGVLDGIATMDEIDGALAALRIAATGPAVQLRGMATAASHQGTGIGGFVLAAGFERAAGDGASLVWARARDAALDFYRRHGCVVIGDGFVDSTTQLPHHLVVRSLRTDR